MLQGHDAGARSITWNNMECVYTAAEQQHIRDLIDAAKAGSVQAKRDLGVLHEIKFLFEASVVESRP